MKKLLLLIFIVFTNLISFSSKEDTLSIYKVLDETMISELNTLFKTKFVEVIDIHEFSDDKFNSLLSVLRKNKSKFWSLKITSPKLGDKYKNYLNLT